VEHVRNAINIGAHTVTVPWKIMKQLTENHFTELGTRQFFEHTRLMTKKVREVISPANPIVTVDESIHDCLVKMTVGGCGAVTIVNDKHEPIGIFTDGDLRRMIEKEGGQSVNRNAGDLKLKKPKSIEAEAFLFEASALFKDTQVDTLVVTENGKVIGMLDIQDLLSLNGLQ
jgi:signal-transduction protein with cAMP-binding, CBS, and nucleotidyltransferase domain